MGRAIETDQWPGPFPEISGFFRFWPTVSTTRPIETEEKKCAAGARRSIEIDGTKPIEATAAPESLKISFNPPDTSANRSVRFSPFAPITHGSVIATLVLQSHIGVSIQFEPQFVFAESVGLGPGICVVHALRVVLDDIARLISEFELRAARY